MKTLNLTKILSALLLTFLISCNTDNSSDDIMADNESLYTTNSTEYLIYVPSDEILDFDSQFEEDMGVYNLDIDSERESFINVNENKLLIPIQSGYVINSEVNPTDTEIKIKEISAGIKFKLARKNPSSNPNKCQGGCKCGIGFRCGSTKEIGVKVGTSVDFDPEIRDAYAYQFIDTENNYYIFEFTTNIDWEGLDNE